MSRRSAEERAASISVRGALIVAGVTLLGSLLISVLTGIITGKQAASNTDSEIKAASQQSKSEFLRQQRQATYSKYLADVVINEQCQFDLDTYMNSKKNTALGHFDLTPINQMLSKCQNLGDTLGQEWGAVSLVSSTKITTQAQSLFDSVSKSADAIAKYVQDVINHSKTASATEGDWSSSLEQIDHKADAIRTLMRQATYGK